MNNENGMMRYEFLECLCRVGIAKYGKGQATDSIPEAVRMLFEQNLVPNLPAGPKLIANDFRNQRLYCEEVDILYKKHQVILKVLYSRWDYVTISCSLVTLSMILNIKLF